MYYFLLDPKVPLPSPEQECRSLFLNFFNHTTGMET